MISLDFKFESNDSIYIVKRFFGCCTENDYVGMGSSESRDINWEVVVVLWEMMVVGGGRGIGVKGIGLRYIGI